MNTPMPSRWACDALADELAAEKELNEARAALADLESREADARWRYLNALRAYAALRGGRP